MKEKISKIVKKAWFLPLIIIISALFLDILSKFLIDRFIELDTSKTIIPNFLNFHYVLNPNAAFSFKFFGLDERLGEEGMRIFFIVFVSAAMLLFVFLMIKGLKNHWLYRLSFALIIGGGLGNLYDRIVHTKVRDFIEVVFFGKEFFGYRTFAIFNLADSFLVIGVILFLIYFIFLYSRDEKKKESLESKESEENV